MADLYSKTVVAPSLGNTTGAMVKYSNPIAVAYNGGYRYKTGNFFYSEIVKQYVDFDGGTGGGVPQPEGIDLPNQSIQRDLVLTIMINHMALFKDVLQQQRKYYIGVPTGEQMVMFG